MKLPQKTYFPALMILIGFLGTWGIPLRTAAIGVHYDEIRIEGEAYLLAMDMMGETGNKESWTQPKMYPSLDKKAQISCLDGLREFACDWEIINDSLFLANVTLLSNNMPEADLRKMFGNRCKGGRVFAGWVNGEFEGYDDQVDMVGGFLDPKHSGMFKVQVVWEVKDGRITHLTRFEHPRNHISEVEMNPNSLVEYIENELDSEFFPPKKEFPVGIAIRLQFDADSLGRLKNIEVECEESEYPLADFSARVKGVLEGISDWTVQYDRGAFVPKHYEKSIFLQRERKPQN